MPEPIRLSEALGRVAGVVLAPVVFVAARLRRSSLFHPRGILYRGEVAPCGDVERFGGLGMRLAGPALVRLSTAWWRGREELPDVLGCAIRFTSEPDREPGRTDQDLLLATIRHPLTTLLAPITTNPHDFFRNDYYAVSPFDARGNELLHVRLLSPRLQTTGGTRWEKLETAVSAGQAVFTLQARWARRGAQWHHVATVRLLARAEAPPTLRFDPFRAGRGLRPAGFVSALRPAVYAASKLAGPGRKVTTPPER